MLDIKFIRENPEVVKKALQDRNVDFDVEQLLAVDKKRRESIKKIDDLRARQNVFSEETAKLEGDKRQSRLEESKIIKNQVKGAEEEHKRLKEEFEALIYKIPNIPFPEVPVGKNERDNKVLREVGKRPVFKFPPRDYMEIATKLDLIDTERAAKVSGTRFGYLKHEAPLLEFAIVQFVFGRLTNEKWLNDVIAKSGLAVPGKPFILLIPPVMIRPEAFRAMGKLDPGQEEERYYLSKDNLYLVGSAEHTIGPLHMDEVLGEEKLPHRHAAFSTCFRREAGSYGKDTKGILRVHQFDKIEMFSFVHPERSKNEHDFFLALQEAMMQELGLPYRVVLICAGDMVWTDAKQYDIETWLPGQNEGKGEYRETHSTSNSTDFQSRRLNAKFRDKEGKIHLVHTINGTAFAIGRTLIGIIENYQQEDGSVLIPPALCSYLGDLKEIKRRS